MNLAGAGAIGIDDLRLPALEDGVMCKKIYEERYGIVCRWPAGATIGTTNSTNAPSDLELVDGLAELGAVAGAPFIAAASPRDVWV